MKFLHASIITLTLGWSATCWSAPLSLQECLNRAHDNNPGLRSAAWDSRIAEENSRQASGAMYPKVDGSAGYTMQLKAQAVKLGGITAETQEPDYAFGGISATHILYDFGRRDARINQANAYTDAATQNFLAYKGDVTLQVIEAYFRILEADRLVKAAAEEVTQITEHRRIAGVLHEEGVVTRNDVLQADVRLASARQNLLAITNSRENSWLLLNYLTGSDPDFRGELDEATTMKKSSGTENSTELSLANRRDLKAQQQMLAVREFEVNENREHYLPEIYARLGMDYVQNDKVREQTIYSATLGLRVNLFDGYAAQAAHEKALKQRSKQLANIRMTEQRALLEITTARNDAAVAKERIAVAEAAIRQSEENQRINKERYQEHVGIASEVLDAQTLTTQAKTAYYRALYDFQTATARLQNALGEL